MAIDLTLITGGIRSGKSEFAERLASDLGDRIAYIATGAPSDSEMRARIDAHRARRPSGWITIEASRGDVAELLRLHVENLDGVLLDDLGGLATRAVMDAQSVLDAEAWMERWEQTFWSFTQTARLPSVVVTSEVGLALVPTNDLGRRFVDVLGRANQRWAVAASNVTMVVAGLPLRLK